MNLRRFLILIGLVGIIVLILGTFGNPAKIAAAFRLVQWYVVPLLISTQLISYFCNSRYYQTFFRVFGNHVPLRELYEISLGINFANQAIPSGGVSGVAFMSEAVREYGVPSGRATLAQLGRYGFTFLSFFVVLAFGFLTLFFSDELDRISVRLAVLLMIILLTLGIILLSIFSERRRLEPVLKPITRTINSIGRRVFKRTAPVIGSDSLDDFLTDFYHGYHQLLQHKRHWPALFGWTLGGNFCEVLTIYVVFLSFGQVPNPGIVITGYALAIIAGSASVLTAGVGVYEAGMIGTFAALGTPFALSIAIVLVYRILSMGIFLPIGLFFYRKHLQEAT